MVNKLKFETRITIIYLLLGILWIIFSDQLLNTIFHDAEKVAVLQTFKGWFYVLITGIFFYYFIKKHLDRLRETEVELELHKNNLQDLVVEKTKNLELLLAELNQTNEQLKDKSKIILNQNSELISTLDNLHSTQNQLVKVEKEASLNVLTTGLAHELNNPLNYILGGYTGLEMYFNTNKTKDETVRNLLFFIKTGIERSSAIVKGLNLMTNNQDNVKVQCDIQKIMEQSLIFLNCQTCLNENIEFDFPNDPLIVEGNFIKLRTAFSNIIINACQAISKDGTVKISARGFERYVQIIINDNGIGIPSENLIKICDPFFTTKDPGNGIGLGLTIASTIIKEHSGSIEIESKENIGTKITVILQKKQI